MEKQKVSGRKKIKAYTEMWPLPLERFVPADVFTEHLNTTKSHMPLSLLKLHFSTAH